MSSRGEACTECTQRCIQLHGKTKNLSSVTSFFKVMFGDLFSKVLYLPPKFAATVSTLVDKKVVLEDALGQQWKVMISNCEGALAFEDGWSAFSSEHSLEIGDFVIFNHIMDFHFTVRIFTKSGCEKIEFAKKSNLRKRTRGTRTSIAFETVDKDLTNPQVSSTSVGCDSNVAVSQDKRDRTCSQNMNGIRDKRPDYQSHDELHRPLFKTENFDDSYCFVNRNKEDGLEEYRIPLFDLFSMEMQKNNPSSNETRTRGNKDDRLEENRSPFLDLFSMEMQKNNPSCNENETNELAGDRVLPNPAAMSPGAAMDADSVKKADLVKGENMEILPTQTSDEKTIEESRCFEEVDIKITVSDNDPCHDKAIRVPFVKSALNPVKNTEQFCDTNFQVVKECQNVLATCNMPSSIPRHDQEEAVSHEKCAFHTDYCSSSKHEDTPNPLGVQNCLSGEVTKIVKQEPLEMTPEVDSHENMLKDIWEPKVIMEDLIEKSNKINGDDNDVHKVVNNDTADSVGISSPNAAFISCLVAEDAPSFLELPTCLPSSNSRGRRNSEKRKIVYLRDPRKRLWPILYHEMPEVQVLTSGWEAFCSANQIEPGDECLFRVEDELLRKYEVSIRKCKI